MQLVRAFFGEIRGYFVEVGANEPRERSQTWLLEQSGWAGVLVEPQPNLPSCGLGARQRSSSSRVRPPRTPAANCRFTLQGRCRPSTGWYVPHDSTVGAARWSERWEILRKYYLALPFRVLRNMSRRIRKPVAS